MVAMMVILLSESPPPPPEEEPCEEPPEGVAVDDGCPTAPVLPGVATLIKKPSVNTAPQQRPTHTSKGKETHTQPRHPSTLAPSSRSRSRSRCTCPRRRRRPFLLLRKIDAVISAEGGDERLHAGGTAFLIELEIDADEVLQAAETLGADAGAVGRDGRDAAAVVVPHGEIDGDMGLGAGGEAGVFGDCG